MMQASLWKWTNIRGQARATSGEPADHWYEFLNDGSTGASLFPDRVVPALVDGSRGDDDLSVNGRIEDPGGPIFVPDTDGDGVFDNVDACPESDLRSKVKIRRCRTGVPNRLLDKRKL